MTADDLQVRALTFTPQHARAIVLTAFRSSLPQNLLEDGLHGPCGPSGAADRVYLSAGGTESVNSPAPAHAMCGCCGCDRVACLSSFRTLVCDRIFGAYASHPMCTRPPCAAGWSTVVTVGGKARGVQHVCTGSPGGPASRHDVRACRIDVSGRRVRP